MKETILDQLMKKQVRLVSNEPVTLHTMVFSDTNLDPHSPATYYVVNKETQEIIQTVTFQHGPISSYNGLNGCFNEDLMLMTIDRLEHFQNSQFKCEENAKAIEYLKLAIQSMNARTKRRLRAGIEGTYKTDETEGHNN